MILSPADKETITAAIKVAEKKTAAEIRVHVEPSARGDALQRAQQLFEEFGMHRTQDRSGVILFVAWRDRRFAVFGDSGIHEHAGHDYWHGVAASLAAAFKDGRYGEGLAAAVTVIGDKLAERFPPRADDRNELADEVTERS